MKAKEVVIAASKKWCAMAKKNDGKNLDLKTDRMLRMLRDTHLKLNSSPLKSYLNLIGKKGSSSFPIIFQGRAVKLRGCIKEKKHV